ncbi:MAG: hypothetical protein GF329_14075 [Candidatus Lokiarchaeota archaeon]|nr:hypothetical protein [Candidatus Lokiarchaeota archaeon]
MKSRTKLFGLLLLTSLLVSFTISLNINSINQLYGSSMSSDIIYNENHIPTNVEITKTESMMINVNPFGEIIDKRTTITFEFRNEEEKNVSFELTDRVEKAKPETLKMIRGSFDEIPEYEILDNGTYGYMIIKFPNITLGPNEREDFGYVIETDIEVNYKIKSEYYVNDTKISLNESETNPKVKVPVGSIITQVINLQKNTSGMFYLNSQVTPPEIALITAVLPYSENEEDRDISEPTFSQAPILQNVISFVQQISWVALSNNYTVNWSATVLRGGGWGILEIQPMMITITKSSEMTGSLLDTVNGLLGTISGLQGYWVALTLDSIIEEFMAMASYFQYFYEMITLESSIANMGLYSMVNNLIIALVETNVVDSYITDSIDLINEVMNATSGPNWLTLWEARDSLYYAQDYVKDVERRITASFGAQVIELLGNPAVVTIEDMEIMDMLRLDRFYLNATASILPDNNTDFYTKIEITNLTSTESDLINLSDTYEFIIMDVPDRALLAPLIDGIFGNVAFTEMNVPGSPNSTLPGIYTSFLNIAVPGEGSFWNTLGNLTRSIATQLLLLNSTFSGKYGELMRNPNSNVNITSSDPFILETGATGINGFLRNIEEIQEKYQSPYGNPIESPLPDVSAEYNDFFGDQNASSMDISFLNNMSFYSQLQIFMDPILRLRNTLNFTVPMTDIGVLENMTNLTSAVPIEIADYVIEDGTSPFWINSTVEGKQYNDVSENYFKRFNVNGSCNYTKNILIPANNLLAQFRINNTNAQINLEIYDDDKCIRKRNIQSILTNNDTWYNFTFDLANSEYWDYYDMEFDKNHITKFKFLIDSQDAVAFDIDYMNLTRSVLPYPNNISIYEGYILTDGIGVLENRTEYSQLNDGLEMSFSFIEDVCGDSSNEIITGSTDKHIYIYKGKSATQLYNISLEGKIVCMFVQDFISGGKNEIIVGLSNGSLIVFNGSGYIIWNYTLENYVNCMAIGNINNDSKDEILVGFNDRQLIALSNSGQELWNHSVKNKISDIEIANVNPSTYNEVITGSLNNVVKCLNGSTGKIIWEQVFDDDILNIAIGNLTSDNYNDIIAHIRYHDIFALSGVDGSEIWNKTSESYIYDLETLNTTSNYDDIIITEGMNITSLFGKNGTEKWTHGTFGIISALKISDINQDSVKEILIGASHNITAWKNNGSKLWAYECENDVRSFDIGDLDNDNNFDLCAGLMDNEINSINLSNHELIWKIILGEWIVSFKFTRTDNEISFYYNLPEPITDLMNMAGINLPDLTSFTELTSMQSVGATQFNGLESLESMPIDMDSLAGGVPLDGLGLLNFIEFELELMNQIQGLSSVSYYKKAVTGVFNVKNIGDEDPDIDIFIDESNQNNFKYIQCDVRNNEEDDITINHFAVDIDYNNKSIEKKRFSIQGYNVTSGQWMDLNESIIENFSWETIGVEYVNGNVVFTNYMEIEPNEKELITTDWLSRHLRIKINISGLNKSKINIGTFIDCKLPHNGITIQPITGSINFNCIYPTVMVYEIPPIEIPDQPEQNILATIFSSPITYFSMFAVGAIINIFYYGKKRENYRLNKLATKKIVNWLDREQDKWDEDLMNGRMSIKNYSSLSRQKLRIKKQYKEPNSKILKISNKFNERLHSNKLLGDVSDILLLRGFWRDIDQRSKLAVMMDKTLNLLKIPLQYFLRGLYWIPKGILKLFKLIFSRNKKKVVKKKSIYEEITDDKEKEKQKKEKDPLEKYLKDIKGKNEKKSKKRNENRKWDGEIKNDGGSKVKDMELPDLVSKEGRIFYYIAQNKYIGCSLKEIADELEISNHEAFFYIMKLYKSGLIQQIREGKTIERDFWDLSSKYKDTDPELEKIIEKIDKLYEEVAEGIIITRSEIQDKAEETEIQEENKTKKEKTKIQRTPIPIPKSIPMNMDFPDLEKRKLDNAKQDKISDTKIKEEK